jgi:hypothetical protein
MPWEKTTVLDRLSQQVTVLTHRRQPRAHHALQGAPPGVEWQRWTFGIASYDPTFDADGRILRAAIASARALIYPTSPSG